MKAILRKSPKRRQLRWEAGGWIALRQPQPNVPPDAVALLARSAAPCRGNLRFALTGQQVLLLGDFRQCDGRPPEDYFSACTKGLPQEVAVSEVAALLYETGHAWCEPSNPSEPWHTVTDGLRDAHAQLTAMRVEGGLQVCSQIARADDGWGDLTHRAVARFLVQAHTHFRFVRFTSAEREVNAVSFAAADRLDIELPDSVTAVVAACRWVAREVHALADNAVARAYLDATDGHALAAVDDRAPETGRVSTLVSLRGKKR